MTDENSIVWRDATDQAALIRTGELTAPELIELAIDRISALNETVGAVIHERFDAARREAKTIDPSKPLAGVPVLVKEVNAMAGEPLDLGLPALAGLGRTATEDDQIVRSLRNTGMIVLGQSVAPELALVSTSENRVHGSARNPWNLAKTPGGSSGGASAAVAAGFVPVGQGGDGGGSLRLPASFCGLTTLKTTRGLVATQPGRDQWGHNVDGYVARSVRDIALLMDLLRGDAPGPVGAHLGARALSEAAGREPGRLRIGVLTNRTTTGEPVDPDVDSAVELAAAEFSRLGHDVVEGHPARYTDPANMSAFFDALSVSVTRSLNALIPEVGHRLGGDEVDVITRMWDERGQAITGLELAAAFVEMEKLRAGMEAWWDSGFDVLLAPVYPSAPLELGWPWRDEASLLKTVDIIRFTAPINTTGQPAVALPVTFSGEGTPIGVQIIGAFGEDELLISLAAQYERARPWSELHPASDAVTR